MKYPKALKSGDYIGVTAPSAGINEEIKIKRLENAEKNLRKKGFNYIFCPCLHFYFSCNQDSPAKL